MLARAPPCRRGSWSGRSGMRLSTSSGSLQGRAPVGTPHLSWQVRVPAEAFGARWKARTSGLFHVEEALYH